MKSYKILAFSIFAALFASAAFTLPTSPIQLVKFIGQDEQYVADVVPLGDGTKAIRTTGLVQIDQLFGQDPQGSTWFYLGSQYDANGIGSAGDTIRVQIKAASAPLQTLYPAVDVTTTVTSTHLADSNPERAVATQICLDLDGDANFTAARWDCIVMKDFSGVFIVSRLYNEFGTRTGCNPLTDCFNVTTTGTTSVTVAYNEIDKRGLGTELQRSPNDPRQGVLGVSGSFVQQPGGTGDLLFQELVDGGTPSMIVDGSVTPINFRINCDSVYDLYINTLRVFFTCSGIKLANWACSNSPLTNGLLVTIRSEAKDLVLLPLKTTSDLVNKFGIGSAGPSGQSRIDIQQGGDSMTSSLTFVSAAIIKKCGTNGTGTDDYIEVKVQDDLTGSAGGNLTEMESLVFGFKREP